MRPALARRRSTRSTTRSSRDTFAPLFQGEHGIAAEVAAQRPFDSLYELRRAFHDALFDADDDAQRALIGSYPDIAAKVALGPGVAPRPVARRASTASTPLEYERFDELNDAYRAKFGHPFLICVRENTKESILDAFERRLQNTPRQEQMAALVEIGKIANLRLLDLVEENADAHAGEGLSSPSSSEAGVRGGARRRRRALAVGRARGVPLAPGRRAGGGDPRARSARAPAGARARAPGAVRRASR